jgi:hypothetical protein
MLAWPDLAGLRARLAESAGRILSSLNVRSASRETAAA